MALWTAPATTENLDKSIRGSISIRYLRDHVSGHVMDAIQRLVAEQHIHCWAFQDTDKMVREFGRLNIGDTVLFHENGKNAFRAMGKVCFKFDSPTFGKIWPKGEKWTHLFGKRPVNGIFPNP